MYLTYSSVENIKVGSKSVLACLKLFGVCILWILIVKNAYTLNVVDKQGLQYVFYSLFSLKKKRRVCVSCRGIKTTPDPIFYIAGTMPPGFEIPGSNTEYTGVFLNYMETNYLLLKYLHIREDPKVVIVHGCQWKPYRCRYFNITY